MQIVQKYTGHIDYRQRLIFAYPAGGIEGPIILEIGPGRGDFLFHMAETNPEKAVYGIEIKRKRFEKLIRRREARGLRNIRLIMADARNALPQLFAANCVDAIYLNFPDPWPKRRHTRNRLLSEAFIKECARVLAPNGTLSITTDCEWSAKEVFNQCKAIPEVIPLTTDITTKSHDAYPTFFAEKWKKEGRIIYYQKHKKV